MTYRHLFSTRRGRKVREAYRQAHPLCEPCERRGKVAAMDEVHHIVPISQGGAPWAWANLESRCRDCHLQVHGGAPRARVDAATGLPIGGRHWWSDDL
jgi:5-methylcytosine-specific restriction endonuclease McrA